MCSLKAFLSKQCHIALKDAPQKNFPENPPRYCKAFQTNSIHQIKRSCRQLGIQRSMMLGWCNSRNRSDFRISYAAPSSMSKKSLRRSLQSCEKVYVVYAAAQQLMRKTILHHSWKAHVAENERGPELWWAFQQLYVCGALLPLESRLWSWFRKWFSPGLGVLPRTTGFHWGLWSKHTWKRVIWQRPASRIYAKVPM